MKYRGGPGLPPSVAVWLEQQLEERGFHSLDYFLSILQDQLPDKSDSSSVSSSKFSKVIGSNLKRCNFEEFKKEVVANCPNKDIEIESLVDELCKKLKAVNSFGNCLKEKDLFNLELPVGSPDPFSKFSCVVPGLHRENAHFESPLIERPTWTKSICRVLGRRKESESSPKENKISKRKEGKENAKSGRMRSRSTVKSQSSNRSRSGMAKSLDRSEKSRKCLFGSGKEEKVVGSTLGREEEFEHLPMDFQSLLQSPDNKSDWYFPKNRGATAAAVAPIGPHQRTFIQCGTNITSSIWSSEKMEEDESLPWEDVGKYVGWSDARNSLLSSAWKLPFAYGSINNNNNIEYSNNNNTNSLRKEDIEGTALKLPEEGSFFSLFNENSNHLSLLSAANLSEKTSSKGKQEPEEAEEEHQPPEELENLLTSMKTHFKPIKQEALEVSATTYNDGSSFLNLNCFEEVKYRRSESGTLFLGPDQKYMEFKRTDLSGTPEFIPKFKVCSNEKFCQTDDIPPDSEEPPLAKDSESEFFFPGDERYAEEVTDSECARIEFSGWVTAWPIAGPSSDDIWLNDRSQPWPLNSEDGKWEASVELPNRNKADYERLLKREICQEGEELLSDIRLILHDHNRPQNLLVGS